MTASVPVAGLRGPGSFSADFRPTNYRELYTFLEPNGSAPLQALLSMAASESTNDPKFNVFQDEMPDRSFTINNGGGYNSSTTTLQLTSGDPAAYVVAGSIIVNSATGEVMRATADGDQSAYTIAVTRNVGGTSLTITNGDKLFVAGFAATEAATSPTAVSWDAGVDYNYTQIFRQAVQLSNTLKVTFTRTGKREDDYITKGLKLHMSDIERAMFWGKRVETNGSTNQALRYTGGLTNLITNTIDVSTYSTPGAMSENKFDENLIETIFAWGSKEKIMFAGAHVITLLQQIGKNKWSPVSVDGGYGVQFTRYNTFAGSLNVYLHPMFRQVPNQSKNALILDLPFIKYRYLDGRDTDFLQDRQSNDYDGVKHEFLTECGLELTALRPHTYLKGWNTLS